MKLTYKIVFDGKNAENVQTGQSVDLSNQDVKVPEYTVNDYVNGTSEIISDLLEYSFDNIVGVDVYDFSFDDKTFELSMLLDVELSNPEDLDDYAEFKDSLLSFENSEITVTSNNEDYILTVEDADVR